MDPDLAVPAISSGASILVAVISAATAIIIANRANSRTLVQAERNDATSEKLKMLELEYSRERDRESTLNELEMRLANQKLETFTPMLELMEDALYKRINLDDPKQLRNFVSKTSRFAMWVNLIGSDEVARSYASFQQATYASAPPNVLLWHYADFLLAARRDLGYAATMLGRPDMLKSLLRDFYSASMERKLSRPLSEVVEDSGWTPPWGKT
ncbi:hypothetical protein [Aquipuribacter nitratireducens]|uniref:Uncharacterized protein n=1 Tax=Aquipuribacter nitratireducens TaxID=650104 RepID=A0ABW0GJC8_9MICO